MRSLSQRTGFTLIETLVAITITSVMAIALGSVFLISMRIWRYASLEAQTSPMSNIILDRINAQTRGAAALLTKPSAADASSTDYVIFLPDKNANGSVIINAQTGYFTSTHWVMYYLVNKAPNDPTATYPKPHSPIQTTRYLYSITDTSLAQPHRISGNIVHFTVTMNRSDTDSSDWAVSGQSWQSILTVTTSAITMQGTEQGSTHLMDTNSNMQALKQTTQVAFRNQLNPKSWVIPPQDTGNPNQTGTNIDPVWANIATYETTPQWPPL